MIRHAQYADIFRLKEIWQEVFGNEGNFAEDYFAHAFSGEETLCYMENGQAVAMLYMLPCRIAPDHGKTEGVLHPDRCICGGNRGIPEKAYYFYALATVEQCRGRGIMGKLIRYAQEEIIAKGCRTVFLIPASESLLSYYERFGFDQVVCPVTYVLKREDPKKALEEAMGVSLEEASLEDRMTLGLRLDWIAANRNVVFSDRLEGFYRKRSMQEKESFFWKLVRGRKTVGFLEGNLEKDQIRIRNYGMDFGFTAGLPKGLFIEEKDRKIAVQSTDVWKHIQGFIPD